MSAIIQAQIDAINNNNFISASDKAKQISALQAQLKTAPPANVSGQNNIDVNKVFSSQQALTQVLGNRVSQITSTPQFVDAKAQGASLQSLNSQLTSQGAFVTTPELTAFNQLIQNQPLTPDQQTNVNNLISRLNTPVISSGSTSSADLYNFLVKSGALNPNPTINNVIQSTQPNQPPVSTPSVTNNSPLPIVTPLPSTSSTSNTSPIPNIPNFTPSPITPTPTPTSSTIQTIPIITDIGNFLNGLFKTNVDPTILGFLVVLLAALVGWYLFKGKIKPPMTLTRPKEKLEMLA